MKLLSFIRPSGKKSAGIVTEQGIIDLGLHLGEAYHCLKQVLALDEAILQTLAKQQPEDYSLAAVTFLPVIEQPNKIICVGMNYQQKRQEFAQTQTAPTLFIRFADSQTAHQGPLQKPACSEQFDYEGELAIIIGRAGYQISEAQAMEHIAGYSCYMDGSVRDWQYSWYTAGKNWPKTGAFGPWLVTRTQISDPQQLLIKTYLNGQQVQHESTSQMIYSVAQLIAYISQFTALSVGDVILTGSPGGVGKARVPPLYLQPNDVVEVDIEQIGRLVNYVM